MASTCNPTLSEGSLNVPIISVCDYPCLRMLFEGSSPEVVNGEIRETDDPKGAAECALDNGPG